MSQAESSSRKLAETLRDEMGKDRQIEQANPFSKHCSVISKTLPVGTKNGAPSKIKSSLRLVHISLAMDELNPELRWQNNIETSECKRTLFCVPNQRSDVHLKNYKKALNMAADLRPHVICINELGFPSDALNPLPDAVEFTRKYVNKNQTVIMAGSYHDAKTFYNTGMIFYPDRENCCSPYFKNISAIDIGEVVSVPSERKTPVIKAFGIEMNPVICLDFLDYSTVANIVKSQIASRQFLRFIMVQSYTKNSDAMRIMSEYVSKTMPGIVSWVNRYSSGTLPSFVHNCGEPVTPEKTIHFSPKGTGVMNFYKINLKKLDLKAKRKLVSLDKRDKWAFGQMDAVLVG